MIKERQIYTYNEAIEATLKYFNGEQLPANVFVSKYAMKDSRGNIYENTPDQMHKRMAKEFAKIEKLYPSIDDKSKLSEYGKKREFLTEEKIYDLFKDFKYAIPQGSVMSMLGNDFQIGSLSNCIVLPEIHDSYGGILYTDQQLVQLSKRRAGIGIDISTLRPENSPVSNAAGTSTGSVSFMDRYSNSCREVAQNGRRGALMISMDIGHPDVEKFITIKQDLTKITGANISVKITDEFMIAVKNNTEYTHRWPINSKNPTVTKTIKARDLWNTLVSSARNTAEPGILFWDRTHKYSTSSVYPQYKNVGTNPCLTSDTWIMLKNGPKQIKDLIGKPFVSLVNGRENISTDDGFFSTGTKKIFLLKTKGGFQVKSTANHPFKRKINKDTMLSEMVELKDIKIGDMLYLSNNTNTEWNGKGNRESGWLLGSLLGDGTFTDTRAYLCYWGDNKLNMKEKAISYLKSNLKYRDGFFGTGSDTTYDIETHDRTRVGSTELKKIAKKYGFNNDKILNDDIEKTSSEFYKGFLSGWFDADGTVQVNMDKGVSVRLSSTILSNLTRAQRMLARLGIISKIYENRRIEGWYDMPDGKGGLTNVFCNTAHELVISKDNIQKFYDEIGFQESEKMAKIDLALLQHKRGFYKEKFIDEVIEITEFGIEEVFDCTVFPDHEFEANGLIVHNCSEIAMGGNDSCRLIAINMYSFVDNPFTDNAEFNFKKWYEINYESQRLMDDLVDLELMAAQKIINKIKSDSEPNNIKQVELDTWLALYENGKNGRRTGLGFTGLADTLAALGFKYDSQESLDIVKQIMENKFMAEFDSSIDMAIERGVFVGFDKDIEETSDMVQMIKKEFNFIYKRMMKHGRRNISISTVAPTGTLSIEAQSSSGLEPVFLLSYKRRKKINPSEKDVKVDFIDELGDKWQEFPVYHPKLKTWMEITGETDENKSPYFGSTANDINWEKRVEMQSIIQSYTTHGLSSTINLPADTTVEQVSEIYMRAWEMGLKGITVYRDGSRSGVLVSNEPKKEVKEEIKNHENHATKRPKNVPCDVIRFMNKGEKWIGFVGFINDKPYEIFTGKVDDMLIPTTVDKGIIRKTKTTESKYDFVYYDKDGNEIVEQWLNRAFDKHYYSYAKLISSVLRHNMPLQYVVELINSLTLDDDVITTWKAGVARMLKRYIPDGTKGTDKTCKECKSPGSVIYQEGCLICQSCGHSKCS